jgi:hypothetical protein
MGYGICSIRGDGGSCYFGGFSAVLAFLLLLYMPSNVQAQENPLQRMMRQQLQSGGGANAAKPSASFENPSPLYEAYSTAIKNQQRVVSNNSQGLSKSQMAYNNSRKPAKPINPWNNPAAVAANFNTNFAQNSPSSAPNHNSQAQSPLQQASNNAAPPSFYSNNDTISVTMASAPPPPEPSQFIAASPPSSSPTYGGGTQTTSAARDVFVPTSPPTHNEPVFAAASAPPPNQETAASAAFMASPPPPTAVMAAPPPAAPKPSMAGGGGSGGGAVSFKSDSIPSE